MTNQQHPITPSPELVLQWVKQWKQTSHKPNNLYVHIATAVAQWGADQELEACCEWLRGEYDWGLAAALRLDAERRPEPPSEAEQALEDLESLIVDLANHGMGFKTTNIRRALERLKELEEIK
jgi:hypothetical protein